METIVLCPKCKSSNTKMPSIMSEGYHSGDQKCLDCGYQGHWVTFKAQRIEEGSLVLKTRKEDEFSKPQ